MKIAQSSALPWECTALMGCDGSKPPAAAATPTPTPPAAQSAPAATPAPRRRNSCDDASRAARLLVAPPFMQRAALYRAIQKARQLTLARAQQPKNGCKRPWRFCWRTAGIRSPLVGVAGVVREPTQGWTRNSAAGTIWTRRLPSGRNTDACEIEIGPHGNRHTFGFNACRWRHCRHQPK